MAAARQRILRKDIRQPDRFMVLMGQCLDLLKRYRNVLIGLGAAVVVAVGAVSGWHYYRGYQKDVAAQAYSKALREYQEGRYEAALKLFQDLRTQGEAPYDTLADLYVANSYIALDQPAKAVEGLVAATGKEHAGFLNQVMLVRLGLAQEMNEACEDALRSLERALEYEGPLRQEAMLAKARCSVRLGKSLEALAAYNAYLEEFPEGETVEIALRLQQLKAASGAPASQTTP